MGSATHSLGLLPPFRSVGLGILLPKVRAETGLVVEDPGGRLVADTQPILSSHLTLPLLGVQPPPLMGQAESGAFPMGFSAAEAHSLMA